MLNSTEALQKWCGLIEVSPDGCWLWRGYLARGYAHFRLNGVSERAGRWAYQQLVRPLAKDEYLDHTCHTYSDNECPVPCIHRTCVNPDHLEPVTHQENVRRGYAKRARVRALQSL